MRCIRLSASSLMKLPCMTCDRDGAMGFSRSSRSKTSSRVSMALAALYVRRELPALVAGRAHDAIELFGLDEQRAARVGIGLPVKLAAKGSVGHALVGGADALSAIQRDLERAEAQPVVALVGGPRRSLDLGDNLLHRAGRVDPPRQDHADGQLLARLELLVYGDLGRSYRPVAHRRESGRGVELEHLAECGHLFLVAERSPSAPRP